MNKIKLVVFDCDGVLVDSEYISHHIFIQELKSYGITIPQQEAYALFRGFSWQSCMTTIYSKFGKTLPAQFEIDYKKKLYEEFRLQLKPIPGVMHVIEFCTSQNIQICVASSGHHEKMDVTLNATGLKSFFRENIFSADDVPRGKPYPDLFLYAAQKCMTPAKACVVIEDSLPGIHAAIAAQMSVIAYTASYDQKSDTVREIKSLQIPCCQEMNLMPALLKSL